MIHNFISQITHDDWQLLGRVLGSHSRIFKPDVTLAPDGNPYLFRWYLMDERDRGSVMIHMQVASDPERPLHDHPWDNQSLILSGRYVEELQVDPPYGRVVRAERRARDYIDRSAEWAHRLIVPEGVPYVLTRFTAGPKVRNWGFWYPDGWHHNQRHVDECAGRGQVSVHVKDKG